MICEDFPCCGHEAGCCPDYDESGNQLNMVCVCGAKIPKNATYSLCNRCFKKGCESIEQTIQEQMPDTPMYEDYYGGE